jgi:UDP-GlcNAc3NAcA epimerase
MDLLTVVGARPQFIKAATVSRKLRERGVNEIIVHTGQHHDANMSQVFFDEMDIPKPDYNLGIHGLGHAAMTGQMMIGIEGILTERKPECVLVYGDTNSTLAGALTAAKLNIPVAHVEAGLRSFNMRMPEEINRIVADRVSKYLFCPTETAVRNLSNEGLDHTGAQISLSGDVMYDSVLYYKKELGSRTNIVQSLKLNENSFVLATLHRAENTDDPSRLTAICAAISEIHKQTPVVLPLHPRTRALLKQHGIVLDALLIDPVGYFDMLALLEKCGLVMTDSGGLQKESYFSGKFCITLRDETEWTELVEHGVNALAGADKHEIVRLFKAHMGEAVSGSALLYGDGNAAGHIVQRLVGGTLSSPDR